MTAQTFHFTS